NVIVVENGLPTAPCGTSPTRKRHNVVIVENGYIPTHHAYILNKLLKRITLIYFEKVNPVSMKPVETVASPTVGAGKLKLKAPSAKCASEKKQKS
ncbi:hypothetical protein DFH28DRAFT_915662, partial [Melampsora americana]